MVPPVTITNLSVTTNYRYYIFIVSVTCVAIVAVGLPYIKLAASKVRSRYD